MTLKEAFRYRNFLNRLTNDIVQAMCVRDNIMATVNTHNMHAANPEASDKTEEVKNPNPTDINAALRLYQRVVDEVAELTSAIEKAKAGLDFSIDACIQGNIQRQTMARNIQNILRNKASETTETGRAYKFNETGEQVPYVYDITINKTERFDRATFKQAMNDALKSADAISSKIDTAMVTTVVDYTMPWDVNATLEDILAAEPHGTDA